MTTNILDDLRLAEQSVVQAEAVVAALLERLTSGPRAEKVGVSAPLEAALRCLQDAHTALAALQTEQNLTDD